MPLLVGLRPLIKIVVDGSGNCQSNVTQCVHVGSVVCYELAASPPKCGAVVILGIPLAEGLTNYVSTPQYTTSPLDPFSAFKGTSPIPGVESNNLLPGRPEASIIVNLVTSTGCTPHYYKRFLQSPVKGVPMLV